MRKSGKIVLGVIAVVFIMAFAVWGTLVYVSDYKITTVDTSVSPDGAYELILQAVGEADFPFGFASGRLVLNEGKNRISKTDFELRDDGGCIRSGIWEVVWQENHVEVILSGEEQIDEQIILYFDGRKEVKQLTDWDRYGENWAWDESEGTEPDTQTAYAGEAEKKPDENDTESIGTIYKYRIPEQSFDVTLEDWGDVMFVSCKPESGQYEDASFFLVKDERILYEFPKKEEDNLGLFDSVGAVAFRDINEDGKEDVVILVNYITGAGPQGMIPRPTVRIYLAGENEFYIAGDMETDIEEHITEEDMTIETICEYLKD